MAAVASSKRWKEKSTSPERNKVWIEPKSQKSGERKVPVVYYLCRNGQLEHPHFMEVPIDSTDGLYLRDVINRLNILRGKGMATMYSWSSKRNYRNGYVWHDLSENDFIYPAHGQEYVLKGSEILDDSVNLKAVEAVSSFRLPEAEKSETVPDFPPIRRRRNQSWSSIDLNEYKVYKNELNSESSQRLAADASTQTEEKRRRRKPVPEIEELEENHTTELSREEISPPPSDSSPETLETLMKAEGRLRLVESSSTDDGGNRTADGSTSGRMKASTVLMQLISCGSISFRDCSEKDQRFSLIGQYKSRLPRGAGRNNSQVMKESVAEKEIERFSRVRLEDKEYFSGSFIETKKQDVPPPALKRSNSYNADRTSEMGLEETEVGGVPAKCISRKVKNLAPRKEESSGESNRDVQVQTGSKRFNV